MAAGRFETETSSAVQTRELGRRLGEACRGGELVALVGELGAGKTQLAKGLAAGLGVERPDHLTSPTFVIVNEYPGRLTFYHIDAYRLAGVDDLEALGADELAGSGGVVAIEWADRVADWLPGDCLTIRIEITGHDRRRLALTGHSPSAARLARAAEAAGGEAFSV